MHCDSACQAASDAQPNIFFYEPFLWTGSFPAPIYSCEYVYC